MKNLNGSIYMAGLVACVAVGLVSAGCETYKPAYAGQAEPDAAGYPQIAVLDELHPYLTFSEPIIPRNHGQPMGVTVPVRANADDDFNVQYRFTFLDQLGQPIAPEQEWRYMRLPARAQRFLRAAALDTTATDWRLEVRPAR